MPVSKELKKRWPHFIRKVYETDPLTCPKCQEEMRIISFFDQPDVIKKILQHYSLPHSCDQTRLRDPTVLGNERTPKTVRCPSYETVERVDKT
ncbi:MAG: hypothetical protein HYV04_15410 [Deltaproteobacteria bacterium]|nr:hypothetical protein [Deltaproteobacteria bacterium]